MADVQITYVEPDGTAKTVAVAEGLSVMEGATAHNIKGMDADCGGACACATCHVYVADAWVAATGTRSESEDDMLDFAFEVRPQSRLACQIKVTSALEGLVVTMPQRQF